MSPIGRTMGAVLAVAALSAAAQDGLKPPAEPPWPRWQARLEGPAAPTPQRAVIDDARSAAPGARLFGDYYLLGLPSRLDGFTGGLRATTGLTVGARGVVTGMPPGIGTGGLAWRERRAFDGADAASTALPYLGLGITGLSVRGGWGISADVGLAGYDSGLRHGRAFDLNAADDVLRELRLAPALQLGVSYAF